MTGNHHPIFNPRKRSHQSEHFSADEVQLAHRNHGMPLEALQYDVTPAGLHYLLIHFDVPYVADVSRWRVSVGGHVRSPLNLSVDDIRQLPQKTTRVTLECAGNGRATSRPRWPSQPWHHEAVGTSEWTGTPLGPLLERAGVQTTAKNVVFYGSDRGFDGGVEHDYGRSLPVAHAMSDDVLLVTAMNGQPLLPQHGFPVRLIVPGWYGMASVKWLDRIEVIEHDFDGYQQTGTYIFRKTEDDTGTPISAMRVKSLIVPPGMPDWYSRQRLVDAGQVELSGRAWSGNGVAIKSVDVSINGNWQSAKLDAPAGPFAWRGWRLNWDARPGEFELACRATDVDGQVQPLEVPFDRGGFGNNAVHKVQVTVRKSV